MYIPLLLFLHFFYAEAKPALAPIKPFFVAIIWVCATYYLPFEINNLLVPDAHEALFLFAQLTGASHLADVNDREEDAFLNIQTPATSMSLDSAKRYGLAWIVVAVLIHMMQEDYLAFDALYDFLLLVFSTIFASKKE